jgi:hypothetical protein
MNRALKRAWARPIRRFWVHTCTLDHPSALGFYKRSGFRPFRRQVEIAEDPRLSGLVRMNAAAHVPLLAS